jgi:LuxR family maltose regulon positive regulatory protein
MSSLIPAQLANHTMTDNVARTLALTKLQRPPVGRAILPRPRLLARLNVFQGLTLVLAPAGFGKTTLLSTWLETCDLPIAWLSLDEHDDDLAVFVTYLIKALHTIFPDAAGATLAAMNSAVLPPPNGAFS